MVLLDNKMVISEGKRAISLSEAERKPAAKPTFQLKAEQIFSTPDGVLLTNFGSNMQAIVIFSNELSNPRESRTENRKKEIQLELEQICKENGIDQSVVEYINPQFAALVAERNDHITQVNKPVNTIK